MLILCQLFCLRTGGQLHSRRYCINYQIKPDTGKSTVNFGNLVDAASEIAVAKDNASESVGALSMNQISGGDKSKSRCGYCKTDSHNSSGILTEARKNYAKHGAKIVIFVV